MEPTRTKYCLQHAYSDEKLNSLNTASVYTGALYCISWIPNKVLTTLVEGSEYEQWVCGHVAK